MATNWSALPLDILTVIAMRMTTYEDFIYFSVVCHVWNHASSLVKNDWRHIPTVPWLLLPKTTKNNPNRVRKIFSLSNNKCYQLNLPGTFGRRCWGSTHGWVAMVDRNLEVQLFNPVTKAQIHFPSLKTLPKPPVYRKEHFQNHENYINRCLAGFCSKLVVLKVCQSGRPEFVIMILYDISRFAAFARHEDHSWTPVYIGSQLSQQIVDVVGMDDCAIALRCDGSIVYLNFTETPSFELAKPVAYSPPPNREIFRELHEGWWKKYLVQSHGDLFMLCRFIEEVLNSNRSDYNYDIRYRTLSFQVFKLDRNDKSWNKVEDFGERAMFVGSNSSMSVSTVSAKFLQRNCIYFTDDQDEYWRQVKKYGGHDMGVYDITKNELRQFYCGDDTRSLSCPPIWFVPQF